MQLVPSLIFSQILTSLVPYLSLICPLFFPEISIVRPLFFRGLPDDAMLVEREMHAIFVEPSSQFSTLSHLFVPQIVNRHWLAINYRDNINFNF